MALDDSALDATAMIRARALLAPPAPRDRMWPAVVAATALAVTSVLFAAVAVLAPPLSTEHVARSAPD